MAPSEEMTERNKAEQALRDAIEPERKGEDFWNKAVCGSSHVRTGFEPLMNGV